MNQMQNVKSPGECVHVLEHSINGTHSTLCQHVNMNKEAMERYYHEWTLTTEEVTCGRCSRILQKEFEDSASLKDFDIGFLKQCGLDRQSKFKEIKFKLQWGTFGEPRGDKLRWLRLVDCSSDLLFKILEKKLNLPSVTVGVIQSILKDREYKQ